MSNGVPIQPTLRPGQQNVVGNSSLEMLTNSTQHDQHMPVDFSVLYDITLLDS